MDKGTIKSLRKEDLLKMLQDQESEINSLKEQAERMKEKLEASQYFELNPDGLLYSKLRQDGDKIAGSIASSAMELTGVFREAQKAADKYLDEIKDMHRFISEVKQKSEDFATAQADDIIRKARLQAEDYERRKSEVISEVWGDIKARLENYYKAHRDIQELLGDKVDISRKEVQKGFEG